MISSDGTRFHDRASCLPFLFALPVGLLNPLPVARNRAARPLYIARVRRNKQNIDGEYREPVSLDRDPSRVFHATQIFGDTRLRAPVARPQCTAPRVFPGATQQGGSMARTVSSVRSRRTTPVPSGTAALFGPARSRLVRPCYGDSMRAGDRIKVEWAAGSPHRRVFDHPPIDALSNTEPPSNTKQSYFAAGGLPMTDIDCPCFLDVILALIGALISFRHVGAHIECSRSRPFQGRLGCC